MKASLVGEVLDSYLTVNLRYYAIVHFLLFSLLLHAYDPSKNRGFYPPQEIGLLVPNHVTSVLIYVSDYTVTKSENL